jgi:hypothetical protein
MYAAVTPPGMRTSTQDATRSPPPSTHLHDACEQPLCARHITPTWPEPISPPPHCRAQVDPKTDGAARDWVAIYDECSRILYQEIDYRLEGQNADTFRTNFKDTPWVKVPAVLWEYSNSQVLTLEYVPGGCRARAARRAASYNHTPVASAFGAHLHTERVHTAACVRPQ